MAGFVISCELLLLRSYDLGLLLRTCNHLDSSFLDVRLGYRAAISTRSKQSRLVYKVLEVCTGKACGCCRDGLEVDVGTDVLVSCVDLEYLLAALDVRVVYDDLSVETSGS